MGTPVGRPATGRTAFVLSGGASHGAVQAGMLHALYERGITADLLVGTSVGAVNGAFVASRPPTVATAERLAEIWHGISRHLVFPPSPRSALGGLVGRGDHLVSDRGLRAIVAAHLEVERLEDLPVPLHVVAAELLDGAERRLSTGPALEAVLASAAIPAVLPPVVIDGRALVDGGMANNTPLSHALELGADEVYVLPTGHACARGARPRGVLALAAHAITIMTQQRLVHEIATLRTDARLVVLPPPCPLGVSAVDFGHSRELVARAREDARAFLDGVPPGGTAVAEVMTAAHAP